MSFNSVVLTLSRFFKDAQKWPILNSQRKNLKDAFPVLMGFSKMVNARCYQGTSNKGFSELNAILSDNSQDFH